MGSKRKECIARGKKKPTNRGNTPKKKKKKKKKKKTKETQG